MSPAWWLGGLELQGRALVANPANAQSPSVLGTMQRKSNEVVETVSWRRVDLCCLQETRWKREGVKQIVGKDSCFKLFWSGNGKNTGGVGILLAEKWWENVFEVVRVSDRIILIRMTIGKTVFVFVCVYAPQANLSDFEKDRFYQELQSTVAKIPASEQLLVCGDLNGHLGSQSTGFEEVHGGQAIGKRNTEGERILEFAFANDLLVGNTWFNKLLYMAFVDLKKAFDRVPLTRFITPSISRQSLHEGTTS